MMFDFNAGLVELERELLALADEAQSVTFDSRATLAEVHIAIGREAGLSEAAELVGRQRESLLPLVTSLVVVGDRPVTS